MKRMSWYTMTGIASATPVTRATFMYAKNVSPGVNALSWTPAGSVSRCMMGQVIQPAAIAMPITVAIVMTIMRYRSSSRCSRTVISRSYGTSATIVLPASGRPRGRGAGRDAMHLKSYGVHPSRTDGCTAGLGCCSVEMLVEVVKGIFDRLDLLGILVGYLDAELLFQRDDKVNHLEGIRVQILDER